MRALITYFVRYPAAGNVLMVLMLIFGYFGAKNLTSSFFPEADSRIIVIEAILPGASPEEVEKGVVLKIEKNLKGITGIYNVSSTSAENAARLMIELEKGQNIDEKLSDVKNSVDRIASFPKDLENLTVYKDEGMNFAISYGLTGDVSLKALKEIARKIEADLLAVKGITKIDLYGFPDEEIEVSFSEERLRAYNLSFSHAAAAIASDNVEITGGTVKTDQEELLIRAKNKGYSSEELKDIVLKATPDGRIVRLEDVAEVTDKWSEVPNKTFLNKKPCVALVARNVIGGDILFIREYVKDYFKEFNEQNTVIEATMIFDATINLVQRIELLTHNGTIGGILVLILLALFLNFRLSFWVAMSIPVSFAGMFILASFHGLTINVISLFAMILVIGILVDDGIVIGENIFAQFEKGKKPLQAAVDGTMQVLPAVTSAILTTVAAFSTFFSWMAHWAILPRTWLLW